MKKKRTRKVNLKKLDPDSRKQNAKKWLLQGKPRDLLSSYSQRYGVSSTICQFELEELGYGDQLRIQFYEKEETEWEYKYDGYTGEMKVVPKGTPDWELHMF